MLDLAALQSAYEKAKSDLLAEMNDQGHWEGELAASALSTATAVSALAIACNEAQTEPAGFDVTADKRLIDRGCQCLLKHQNPDGGWGDTDRSYSNISTTMLVIAAFQLAGCDAAEQVERARAYVDSCHGIDGLRRRYGRDKTFAVPILTNYALAGLVDWSAVSALPFEFACLPQKFYRWARLPVVSYAIPALVAIGQARFLQRPPRMPWTRMLRREAVEPSLRVLERMQPDSGGYLEAIPLTSFVTMSLAATGRLEHPVTQRGLVFLRNSARADGSWPIDTNLATWNTTLAINALSEYSEPVLESVNWQWLLSCQHRQRHPFTGADPGGWGWSDLSGAVPDADDTAGALLALSKLANLPKLGPDMERVCSEAADLAVGWLLDLQNRDGGWPTFCRGWGKLPFDRSGSDLTAHVLRALLAWREHVGGQLQLKIPRALDRGWSYLQRQQRADGSWVPLWFGNQDQPDEENPVFGTARVLRAFAVAGKNETSAARRGYEWLASAQQSDGGWSGGTAGPQSVTSSVEETALAVEALGGRLTEPGKRRAEERGLVWLIEAVSSGRHRENAPIGFYFAKLWYYERLYPLVFTVSAMGQALRTLAGPSRPRSYDVPE